MSETKRMDDRRFESFAQLDITKMTWPEWGDLYADWGRARSSEAALEARLAAGVEAAREMLDARGADQMFDAFQKLRAFVEGSR